MIVRDSAVVVVPADIDPTRFLSPVLRHLGLLGERLVRAQAAYGTVLRAQDWHVTDDADELRAWDMAHVCAECLADQLAGIDFLLANPGRYVAYATITYDEPEMAAAR